MHVEAKALVARWLTHWLIRNSDKVTVWDFEIIGNTLVHVEVEELIDTLASTLAELKAKALCDTRPDTEAEVNAKTLSDKLVEV